MSARWTNKAVAQLGLRSRSGASRRRSPAGRNGFSVWWQQFRQWVQRAILLGLGGLVLAGLWQGGERLRAIEVGEISVLGYSGSVHNNRGITLAEVMELLAAYRQQPYWQADLLQMQADLEAHPWVRTATIFREWPNRLRIGIDEQVPIARWNSSQLLASSGELIDVPGALLFSSLPRFSAAAGMAVDSKVVLMMVEHYNSLQRLLGSQYQTIVEVALSEANDLRLVLKSGARIELGKVDQPARLQRLVLMVERGVIPGWERIAEADLRYARGISIRWADSELEEELDSLIPLVAMEKEFHNCLGKLIWREMHG